MNNFIQSHRVVQELTPYVVVRNAGRVPLDFSPFGLKVARENRIDPTRMDSEGFLAVLQHLDGRTFGPEGMPMDRWVFYDCCYMPGAIFGFGRPADTMSDNARDVLGVPDDYTGLVPYSMYIAIPMASRGAWMGHNLASIGPMLPDERLQGLGTLTKSVALRCFGTERFFGATQWSSRALWVHVKFGPLAIHTAYTPAHSEAETITYGFQVTDDALLSAAGSHASTIERPEPDLWITAGDADAMKALQTRIEAGEKFVLPSAPVRDETSMRVPVAKIG